MTQPAISFESFVAALDTVAPAPPPPPARTQRGSGTVARSPANDNGDHAALARSESALRYLIERGKLDLGTYKDWLETRFALKATHGEPGFDLWHRLSAEADKYEGEEACRAKWDADNPSTERQPLTMGTFIAAALNEGWKPQASTSRGRPKTPSPAIVVRELAREAGDEFWVDLQGIPHVTFMPSSTRAPRRRIHTQLDSAVYKGELGQRYADAVPGRVLSKDQLNLALGLIAYEALKGERHQTYLRAGQYEGALYISRGTSDGRCIKVTPDEITEAESPPLRFLYRGEAYVELPAPVYGGTVADFARHYNVSNEDVINLIAIQLVALIGADSYPICLIEGQQGTGKSTLLDMIKGVIDPTADRKQGRAAYSRKEDDLYITASTRHILCFDNISIIDQAASDALCRMSTGGSLATRALYTNQDEHSFSVCRLVVATAIGTPTKRGDFLNRCITVTALPMVNRRTERRIWEDFVRDRAKLFGFLLTAAQAALRNLPAIEAKIDEGGYVGHRMADFAAIVEAAASELGVEPGEFSARQWKAQEVLQADSAMGDPFIMAIHDYFSRNPGTAVLELTARELLAKVAPDGHPPKGWPAYNQVKRVFQRNAAGLVAIGLKVEVIEPKGHRNMCMYRISREEEFQASDTKVLPTRPPF